MEIGHEPMRVTSQGPEETLIRGIFAPIRLRLHNDGCLDHALSLQGLGHNNNICNQSVRHGFELFYLNNIDGPGYR